MPRAAAERKMAPTFQHRDAPRSAYDIGHAGQLRAAERSQRAARQLEPGELRQLVVRCDEHGDAVAPARGDLVDDRLHRGQPFRFHEQRQRLHASRQRALNHLARLGDEQRFLRLQLAAQLRLGQPRERIQPRIVQRFHVLDHRAASSKHASRTPPATSATFARPRSQNSSQVMMWAPMKAMSSMFAACTSGVRDDVQSSSSTTL